MSDGNVALKRRWGVAHSFNSAVSCIFRCHSTLLTVNLLLSNNNNANSLWIQ